MGDYNVILERRKFIEKNIDIASISFLEIGALHAPTYNKNEVNIKYLDWLSKEESIKAHKNVLPGEMVKNFVDVDYVIKDKDFHSQIDTLFDCVIANHLVEHIADLVTWFDYVDKILNTNGKLFLAVPDKKYTFDFIRPVTTTGEILRYKENGLHSPDFFDVFDMVYSWRNLVADDVWSDNYQDKLLAGRYTAQEAYDVAKDMIKDGYADVHVHVFSYKSFIDIINDLRLLNLLNFKIVDSYDVQRHSNEFFVLLEKV